MSVHGFVHGFSYYNSPTKIIKQVFLLLVCITFGITIKHFFKYQKQKPSMEWPNLHLVNLHPWETPKIISGLSKRYKSSTSEYFSHDTKLIFDRLRDDKNWVVCTINQPNPLRIWISCWRSADKPDTVKSKVLIPNIIAESLKILILYHRLLDRLLH